MAGTFIRRTFCLSLFIVYFSLIIAPSVSFAADPVGYASVSGHVKDNISQQPLEGVKIKLICGLMPQEAITDSSGYYEFPQVPIYEAGGSYLNKTIILTFALKYKTDMQKTELMPGQNYVFDFYLDTRFKYPILQGQVTDGVTAAGIPEAEVTVSNESESYSAITDADGYYQVRIENKGVGQYQVAAKAYGYLDSPPQDLKTFPTRTYTLNFSLEKVNLGVSASPDYWQIGEIGPGTIITMPEGNEVTVTNTGSINATYSLVLVNPVGWTASQTAVGVEEYILNASFASGSDNINWNEANHALSVAAQRATASKFAGDQTGVDIAPAQERKLWLQFKAPTKTSIAEEQNIEVIITAELP